MITKIRKLLGDKASLLDYQCTGVTKDQLHLPAGLRRPGRRTATVRRR
jgi:hypothetical protein